MTCALSPPSCALFLFGGRLSRDLSASSGKRKTMRGGGREREREDMKICTFISGEERGSKPGGIMGN